MNLPQQIKTVLSILRENGGSGYIVGGCVRDMLMGKTPNDYDVTTDLTPDKVISAFSGYKVIPTGIKHGTVTVHIDHFPVEITTFRTDGAYSDGRHPDSVRFVGDIKDDLSRRDFTVNAMARGEDGTLIDPFGGEGDLRSGIIRAVGDPSTRFREDALRILRAVRFASKLGFSIEDKTAEAMFERRELLGGIASERICAELLGILGGKNVRRAMTEYCFVWDFIIPEIPAMKGFEQRSKWHLYDVLEHTLRAVENMPEKPGYLRLAALLHDVGKPSVYFFGADGYGHFKGHVEAGFTMSEDILRRLKTDNFSRERVLTLIKYHDTEIENDDKTVRRWLGKLGAEAFYELMLLKTADRRAQNPEYAEDPKIFTEIAERARKLNEEKVCTDLSGLKISGCDIMALGVKPGRRVGVILNELLSRVIDGQLENTPEALKKAAEEQIKTEN